MARVYHMTWIPSRRGWMKEYKGKKYAISCRQLGVPETKDGSYRAANDWWAAKEALDAANRLMLRPLLPMEDLAAAVLGKQGPLDDEDVGTLLAVDTALKASRIKDLEVFVQIDEDGNATIWPRDLGRLPGPEDKLIASVGEIGNHAVRQLLKGQPLPDQMANLLPPARVQQVQDAVAGLRGEATAPEERTVAANCERWVSLQQAKVAGGKLAPDRADNLRIYLNHFRDFLAGAAAVDGVDAQKLEAFYRWCMQKVQDRQKDKDGKAGWSAVYAKKVFDTARVFVRYLWESGLIELPRNINSREFNGSCKSNVRRA